jgi:putative cardiolipin synthase
VPLGDGSTVAPQARGGHLTALHPLVLVFVLVLATALAGCAGAPLRHELPPSFADTPRDDSRYAPIEGAIRAAHGPAVSGFSLLERNQDALKWRLALVDTATHSVDLQYYVWFGDISGQLLMARVIAAADRGVKVRLLFDDLSSLLRTMTSVEFRDEMLARVDAHPNIQVRVFNGWRNRALAGRLFEGATEFSRINRRMHNKQMIADNRVAIIGGRNIGDEYMGLNGEFNFHDLDVLGVGPVARQASAVFDRYWNSEWVGRIPAVAAHGAGALRTGMIQLPPGAAAHPLARELLAGERDWTTDVASLGTTLLPGTSVVHTDSPVRDAGTRNHMPEAFRALLRSARREVLITNAYIIPDEVFIADLRELSGRGVRVRILTNSLASHDVPAVNAHYEPWRKPILETGASLHEFRADAAIRAELVDTPPVKSGFAGLHTKAMVIDRERSFVGSMNMDPRSQIFNSEMGVIVESRALADALARRMERDMTGANSWHVVLSDDRTIRWRSDAGEVSAQPARSAWQRVQNVLFKLFPASYY